MFISGNIEAGVRHLETRNYQNKNGCACGPTAVAHVEYQLPTVTMTHNMQTTNV